MHRGMHSHVLVLITTRQLSALLPTLFAGTHVKPPASREMFKARTKLLNLVGIAV